MADDKQFAPDPGVYAEMAQAMQPMTKPPEPVVTGELKVTQDDRVEAARVYQHFRDPDYAGWILAGTNAGGDYNPIIQAFARHRTAHALPGDAGEGRAWPSRLTQGLREILGIPNFQCGPMARAYQKIGEFSGTDGLALEKRAEDEQAFILHKLVAFWFEHGDGWREPAIDEIDRAAKLARATLPSHQGAGDE